MGAVLLCAAPLPAGASERSSAARRAADHLIRHQAPDGTFFGDDAPHRTAETLVALVAAGSTGAPVSRAYAAVTARGPAAADRAGEAGLLVLGVVAAGGDPRDYVAHLHSFYEDVGAYDTQQFQNALALLGVVAAGERLPEQAITFLRINRCPDGGIPIQVPCGGAGGHVDVTALVLQALVAHGMPASDPLRADARTFLAAARNHEGGFGDKTGAATNANSTGLVLAAVAALGEPTAGGPWRDALRLLLGLQQRDGRFHQSTSSEGDSYLATRQAIPGVAGRPYPVRPNVESPPSPGSVAPSPSPSPSAMSSANGARSSASTPPTTTTASAATPGTAATPATAPVSPASLALRRNETPEPRLSPQSAVEESGRDRPAGPAAIATALLLAVAWWGARLPRPRGDDASAP